MIIITCIYLYVTEYPNFCHSYDSCEYETYKNTWNFHAKAGLAIVFSLTILGFSIYISKLSNHTAVVNSEKMSINLAIKEARIFKAYGKTDEAVKRLKMELKNHPNNKKIINELKHL